MSESEIRFIPYREQLVDSLPEDRNGWGLPELRQELTCQLLDFHRRAAKPLWRAMFSRQDMDVEELVEDIDCLAGLTINPAFLPYQEKRSILYFCIFPEQETKLKSGDTAMCIEAEKGISNLCIDEDARKATFKYSVKNKPIPDRFSIGPAVSSPVILQEDRHLRSFACNKSCRSFFYKTNPSQSDGRSFPSLINPASETPQTAQSATVC